MLVQRYKNIPHSFIYFDIEPLVNEFNVVQFTLSNAGKYDFDIGFVADQLTIYPKAKVKLPSFTDSYCLFTPQSYEQSSSEILALFKCGLIVGNSILDVCGGLGVDDWAFAKKFKQVVSIDIDGELNKLVRRNFEKLKAINIERIDGDAYDFVNKNVYKYDWVYVDSDRRTNTNRSFAIAETEPNILKVKDKIFSFTDNILLKVSPMLDLHAIINELQTVKHIWIVSHKNELKEILIHLHNKPCQAIVEAVNIESDKQYHFSLPYPFESPKIIFDNDGLWFYEPALALIKANLASAYLLQEGINQVAQHSIYGVSTIEVMQFFGRKFKLFESFEFSKGRLKTYLANNHITKANIAKRNFPMEVDELRKLTSLKDGGSHYLFFTQDSQGEKRVFHCGKV